MKTHLLGLFAAALVSGRVDAAVTASFDVGEIIPDFDANGLVDVGLVSGSGIANLGDVNVWFEVAGGFTGDLLVTLSHGADYAVLVNRPGRTVTELLGYADEGFSSTFLLSDQALNGDVHGYRQVLFGDPSVPLGGDLDGTWAPDGRTTDPGLVLDTDARTALLSGFNGAGADGEWVLHLADLAPGGQGVLVRWGLDFLGVGETETENQGGGGGNSVVPEPATWALGAVTMLGILGGLNRRRRRD